MAEDLAVNGPSPEVMWPISRIAERDGVSKPNVSQIVKRLCERQGLTVTRDHLGRVSLVNVVEYDALRERYGDPSKAQAPARSEEGEGGEATPARVSPLAPKNSYEEAVRVRAWHEVEKRRLEVGELRGKLIRADRYTAAVGRCSDELVRVIDMLPQEADAIAAELNLDEVHRLRLALKSLARRLRERCADAFDTLAAEAPAFDDPISDDGDGGEG